MLPRLNPSLTLKPPTLPLHPMQLIQLLLTRHLHMRRPHPMLQLTPQRRMPQRPQMRLQPTQPTPQLMNRNPLHRHRHHNPSQRRLRLTNHHRLHRLTPGAAEVLGEVRQPSVDAGLRGILTEVCAEARVGQQPLDQRSGADALLVSV
jgi:hypothetical protein